MWPNGAHTLGNAGVMLVGRSVQHGDVPAVLLGGRFYTGKKEYRYTDFGGGVDRKQGESPQQGAFREFAEELLGQDEDEAKATAAKLCEATTSALVGGRPFVHKNYVMFVVAAETVADTLELACSAAVGSAIDNLFVLAKRNAELTSVALVSIEEMVQRGLNGTGMVCPLRVRQLDGEDRSSEKIWLRALMVGTGGSIATIRDALEGYQASALSTPARRRQPRDSNRQTRPQHSNEEGSVGFAGINAEVRKGRETGDKAITSDAVESSAAAAPRRLRWGRGYGAKAEERSDSATSSVAPLAPAVAAGPAVQASNLSKCQQPTPYIFDMETGDPDDVLTLLFLASHPAVHLCAVTITPGSNEQVALVRWLLQQMGLTHVRLGAQAWPKNATTPVDLRSGFYKSFGRSLSGEPKCERADQVLLECCDKRVTLVTGGPLHNLGDALKMDGFLLGRLVAQGGFAGEGVVPRQEQMDKFKGKEVCRTWNFGGNIPAAQAALASAVIERKVCVSKNVCHSVYYDHQWHRALRAAAETEAKNAPASRRALAFGMMYNTMDQYLRQKPGGKKLHDPLALAVALDESVCTLAEVQLFCQKGQWGSRLLPGSNVWISVAYDAAKFQAVLLH